MRISADRVSTNAYRQGESPRWDATRRELVHVSMAEHLVVVSTWADGRLIEVARYDLGVTSCCASPMAGSDAWVVAAGDGILRLDRDGGTTPLVSGLAPRPDVMNDGSVDPCGRLWIGSQTSPRRPDAHLWRLDPDGSCTVVLDDVTVSNGLGFSADGRRMYYLDTLPRRTLEAFDVTDDGRLEGRRDIAAITTGNPDGLVVDDDECCWVAVWDGAVVERRAPTGELLCRVELPVPRPTACTIVGTTLLVTTASVGLSPAALADAPDSGAVFAAEIGVGAPAAVRWGATRA